MKKLQRIWKYVFLSSLACLGFITALVFIWPQKPYTPYQTSETLSTTARAYPIPKMPEGWTWQYYTAPDGARLHYGHTKINPNKANVLLIPGYTGTALTYGDYAQAFHAQGYNVFAVDVRGHGKSARALINHKKNPNPEKAWVKNFEVYTSDLNALLHTINQKNPQPVFVLASSFGAHITYRTLVKYPNSTIAGALLLAPAFEPKTTPFPLFFARAMINSARLLGKGTAYAVGQKDWAPYTTDFTQATHCSSAPQRLYKTDSLYALDPSLRVSGPTNQWLGLLIESGKKVTRPQFIKQVNTPHYMIFASDDKVINNAPAIRACTANAMCQSITFPQTGHCLNLERDEVVENTVQNLFALINNTPIITP